MEWEIGPHQTSLDTLRWVEETGCGVIYGGFLSISAFSQLMLTVGSKQASKQASEMTRGESTPEGPNRGEMIPEETSMGACHQVSPGSQNGRRKG